MAACAIKHSQTYMYGFTETMNSLLEKAPIILVGSALATGIGYLAAGSPAAYTAAKVSFCLLSVFYGLGHPEVVAGISTSSEKSFRLAGNITPLLIPPFFF
ncbi:MAG: hypothetical protein Q8L98_02035 [Chlamydiales bacterium]|nr:hypothetical protein [Chlamydiales bacterium]